MSTDPEQRPNSRKGIPNGESKHYGDRDQRFKLDMEPEEAVRALIKAHDGPSSS